MHHNKILADSLQIYSFLHKYTYSNCVVVNAAIMALHAITQVVDLLMKTTKSQPTVLAWDTTIVGIAFFPMEKKTFMAMLRGRRRTDASSAWYI